VSDELDPYAQIAADYPDSWILAALRSPSPPLPSPPLPCPAASQAPARQPGPGQKQARR
jgi:hypothetical protein